MRRQTYGYLPGRRASPPLDRYQIYWLVTEALVCEQLAQLEAERPAIEPATFPQVQRPNHNTTRSYVTVILNP